MSTSIAVRINGYKFTYFYGNAFGDDGVIVAYPQDKPIGTTEFTHALQSAIDEFDLFSSSMWYSEVFRVSNDFELSEAIEAKDEIERRINAIHAVLSMGHNHLHENVYGELLGNLKFSLGVVQSAIEKQTKRQVRKTKKKRVRKPGHIYLLQAVTPHNHYKIGLSKEPVKRIESMGVKLPFPIEPLHTFPTDDMAIVEKALHNKYADKRVNGEWFELSEQDVADICTIDRLNAEDIAS